MDEGVGLVEEIVVGEEGVDLGDGFVWDGELGWRRRGRYAEGSEELLVVVDGVEVADGGRDEGVVGVFFTPGGAEFFGGDALGGAAEPGHVGGAIGAGDVEAGIDGGGGEVAPEGEVGFLFFVDEEVVNGSEEGAELGGGGVDDEGDVGVWEFGAEGLEGGGGEDEVAEFFELEGEEGHGAGEKRTTNGHECARI
jgi:hypothetical protein